MDKHSYIDEKQSASASSSSNEPKTDSKETGTSKNDQKDLNRTDPGLKKGYNEKNPSQPQGGFTPDSQADEPSEKNQGDESK